MFDPTSRSVFRERNSGLLPYGLSVRLTLVHQVVVLGLMVLGMGAGWLAFGGPGRGGSEAKLLLLGVATMLVLAPPIFRWLCLWPLVFRCPRCGGWVGGVYRDPRAEGLLVVAAPCGHGFVMRGAWVAPIFRRGAGLRGKVAEELGWAWQEDGRVFRPHAKLPVDLLGDGAIVGHRRARWPYWFVCWKDDASSPSP